MPSIELIKLSPSRLGRFLECPACFWKDYHGKLPPTFPLPGILNRMDRITKEYYDNYRKKIPPILKGKLTEKLVDSQCAEILRKGIKCSFAELNAELKGKMDDCMIDSDGKYVVVDNKTASPSNEELLGIYKMQLDAYAFILQQNNYKTAKHGYLIYYVPDSGDPEKGVVFKAEVKKLELSPERIPNIIAEAVKLLRKSSPPKAHKDCEMCEYLRDLGEAD